MGTAVRRGVSLFCAAVMAGCGGAAPTTGPPTVPPSTIGPTVAPTIARPTVVPTQRADLVVVGVGDSIPYNARGDCPGCVGFVDQYAEALAAAAGKSVAVDNRSKHTGLVVDQLLGDLIGDEGLRAALAEADVIIVGIAHNDVPMNRDDDACDGPNGETPDWSAYTDACIAVEVERFTPLYRAVYSTIASLATRATILRTINRYNDWIGWPAHPPPPAGERATARVIAAWNDMICSAAEANGFACADISSAFNGSSGLEASGDLVGADYTHPSQNGNDVIAEVLIQLGFGPLV